MESPTYWGAILAAAAGRCPGRARARAAPTGPDPDELARAFDETGARLFYAQPNYANPTGAQWPPELREQVLDVVREHGAFLVEDDWAHDFGITTDARARRRPRRRRPRRLPALADQERVPGPPRRRGDRPRPGP